VSKTDSTKRTILIMALAGITILALLAAALWQMFFPAVQSPAATPPEPPLRFGYCGAELTELCVLSFGRDAHGNSIINFFAPEDFPDFYLRIQHFDRESIYVCIRNEETPTSVLCMGDVIHLNERVEIGVLSAEDYSPLAGGTFTLTAILISSQTWDLRTPTARTPTPVSSTQSPTPQTGRTPTLTPSVSYPSYP
jgi:hypothetical protein